MATPAATATVLIPTPPPLVPVALAPVARLAVVVPVRQAGRTLTHCLAALRESCHGEDAEIVVVRDGEELQPDQSGVRELRSPVTGSAAAARNQGAAERREGILIFVDSDVVLDRDALHRLVEPILAGAAEATVGNYSSSVEELSFLQAYKQLYIATIYSRRRGYVQNEFWTAIGAVRAEVFHYLGGFDTAFGGACGEDTELGHRLTSAGFRILSVPEATGQHLHEFTLSRLLWNDFRKGRRTMLNALMYRNLVSGNRHSTPSDILAVLCAVLTLFPVLLGALLPLVSVVATTALFVSAWLLARRDLLQVYNSRSRMFFVRAVPLALLLDWVRALCVATALAQFAWDRTITRCAKPA